MDEKSEQQKRVVSTWRGLHPTVDMTMAVQKTGNGKSSGIKQFCHIVYDNTGWLKILSNFKS